jgi:hypothetical protein
MAPDFGVSDGGSEPAGQIDPGARRSKRQMPLLCPEDSSGSKAIGQPIERAEEKVLAAPRHNALGNDDARSTHAEGLPENRLRVLGMMQNEVEQGDVDGIVVERKRPAVVAAVRQIGSVEVHHVRQRHRGTCSFLERLCHVPFPGSQIQHLQPLSRPTGALCSTSVSLLRR